MCQHGCNIPHESHLMEFPSRFGPVRALRARKLASEGRLQLSCCLRERSELGGWLQKRAFWGKLGSKNVRARVFFLTPFQPSPKGRFWVSECSFLADFVIFGLSYGFFYGLQLVSLRRFLDDEPSESGGVSLHGAQTPGKLCQHRYNMSHEILQRLLPS